ncbi:MAG: iron-containing alcohol dehydrogenase, partial [Desulfurococcales archaeon]|nr:iron-containing alcohol dehydrogenase [Desulfurococcales archaeon]
MPEIVLPRRIIFGEDVGEGIVGLLGYLSAKKVLVVTDGVISRLEKYTELINSLKNAGIEVVEFKSVPPEPPIEIGEKIAESAGD